MKVSKEELLHIVDLADLKIEDNEVDKYLKNLDDILNYTEVIQSAPIENLKETIGANDNANVFRKDEIKVFEDHEALLQNAPEVDRDMFKIPKVIQ
jgi:aspartyl-tRNA(Asn)/glutamyl-tRNA(Gln) amidotransferase subunit C